MTTLATFEVRNVLGPRSPLRIRFTRTVVIQEQWLSDKFRSDGGWRLHTPIPSTLPRSRTYKPLFHVDDISDLVAPNRHLGMWVWM